LGGFLAEDDEEGVEEVEDLGDVEEPEEVAHHGVGGVERLAGEEGVVLYYRRGERVSVRV
jgi:hypothetical protein